MKRIHLFEFEDSAWFPGWIRQCMTRFIVAMHKVLGSADDLAELLARALQHAETQTVIDLCSGSGGPMPDVYRKLKKEYGFDQVHILLSDLYPNKGLAERLKREGAPGLSYLAQPVDATHPDPDLQGVRSMVCSMHHMKPTVARQILQDAWKKGQPICIYEISDNSFPIWLWWLAIPLNFLMVFFITPFVRPLSWKQVVFTYLIPILPLFIAWDGAVSNARTYTLTDMDELLKGLGSEHYKWEKGIIKGKANTLYLLGLPVQKLVKHQKDLSDDGVLRK